jgi:hypothetical protein
MICQFQKSFSKKHRHNLLCLCTFKFYKCNRGAIITTLDTILGKTGNTGNAGSMTRIEDGAHLHFEVRTEITKSMGKSGMTYRQDPFLG